MRLLGLILLVAFALALAWFSALNWTPVTLNLWNPYQLVIRLPVLMVACVLIGWLPTALVHAVERWQLKRRLTRTERALESQTRAAPEEPLEMPALKSRAAPATRAPGSFVAPEIPMPRTDDL